MAKGDPRKFYTGSVRIISDASLSGLDHRVYACISLHDGMSMVKGKGAGCYASNQTIAALVGCDYTNLSKSVRRLREAGYIVEERSRDDKRMKVFRVLFPEPGSWRIDQLSRASEGDPGAEIVGEGANQDGEIVGGKFCEQRANLPKTDEHYIPLKGELDSVETEEIDSVETARLNGARLGEGEREPSAGEILARFERALKQHPNGEGIDLVGWIEWLETVQESHAGEPEGGRALRLSEKLIDLLPDDEFQAWQAGGARTALPVASLAQAPDALDAAEYIRPQVERYYQRINAAGRAALAKSCNISASELRQYVEGAINLSIFKQMALHTATKEAA